ncbi:F-box/LRR-repeat protein 12-like [Papaver somniferum]|uniref:F-box/LRR-repeat protein 12-like n=2 Tax=Papaver somniferum TaxID=3469 RepID=UPI000E6FD317|nr:F-box/LRR-repeat protein 12-like [Papaver somniferum]
MSLSPNRKRKQGFGKIRATSKTLQEQGVKDNHVRPCKISRMSLSSVPSLPGDCLDLIFKCLKTRDDRNSFGLTCHQWLHIRDNNQESLWCKSRNYEPADSKISSESAAIIICNLLIRFQNLQRLSLKGCPGISEVVTSKSQSFGSKVRTLDLRFCSVYSDMQLALVFSWFPRLTRINLHYSNINDNGLAALAKCCSSLETVNLSNCCSITDSGLSCLLQNCRELRSLFISYCSSITGIGFLGCSQTLNRLGAGGYKHNQEVLNAIISGGELEYLYLETAPDESAKIEDASIINIDTEAVLTISRGCPLLKELFLSNCEEVELEGYEAIGMNCKELEKLYVMGCQRLCDTGLQAICDGCNKLIELYIDREKNSCSSSALEQFNFKGKKPELILWPCS